VVLAAVFGWLLWQGPWILDRAHLKDVQPGSASVVSGFRTAVVAFGAGLVAAGGLFFTYHTLQQTRRKDSDQAEAAREQANLTRESLKQSRDTLKYSQDKDQRQEELAREAQAVNQYPRAISLLASDKLTERLGGIYALERIMRDSEGSHATVVEMLVAFLREHAVPTTTAPRESRKVRQRGDIQAALTVLGRRPAGRFEADRLS
jgi:hypothetical protein